MDIGDNERSGKEEQEEFREEEPVHFKQCEKWRLRRNNAKQTRNVARTPLGGV